MGRYGIRVNGIGPDLTQTPQVDYLATRRGPRRPVAVWAPVGRLGWPEDQARVALFLASDMSSFVTGHNVPVDGGTKAGGGWFFSPSRADLHQPADRLSERAARSAALGEIAQVAVVGGQLVVLGVAVGLAVEGPGRAGVGA